MRIRSTKPEFWRSKRVASVDWDARLVVKGLESYVDDNGVGKDDLALIVADIFPRDLSRDPLDTLARVQRAISALHEAGLVWRYQADGNDLLYIAFWEDIQRVDKPNKPRFRRPDGTWAYGDSSIRESVANIPETLAPGTGEQGNRGTGEQGNSDEADASSGDADPRRDVEDLCTLLADLIEANGSKRPTITKSWRDACRRMLDIDGREPEQIEGAMRWAQADDFWQPNIQSMPKLREKFDTLRLQAQHRPKSAARQATDSLFDRAAERMGVTA